MATATAIVGPGAAAHLAAGGQLAPAPTLGVWAALALAVAAVSGRVRWTFTRLTLATLLAQPVLHWVFAVGRGAHASTHLDGGHAHTTAHAAGHAPAVIQAGHGSVWMAIAHVAVAFAVAAILRWGVRWLRSMPALACALVMAGRGRVAPIIRPALFAAAPPAMRPVHLAVATSCGTRGPPR